MAACSAAVSVAYAVCSDGYETSKEVRGRSPDNTIRERQRKLIGQTLIGE